MDFEKLKEQVASMQKDLAGVGKGQPDSLRSFCVTLRDVLMAFLKDRKEPVRPGRWFRDAAAKSIVPGDIAPRADALITRWSGQVTPSDPARIKEDAARLKTVADKILPILDAYTQERG